MVAMRYGRGATMHKGPIHRAAASMWAELTAHLSARDEQAAELSARLAGSNVPTKVLAGEEGLLVIATLPEASYVMAAIVAFGPTFAFSISDGGHRHDRCHRSGR